MKCWQLAAFGLENLHLTDVLVPEPGPGEVLVRVEAVSLNYRDRLVIQGELLPGPPAMPFVPASDMAGKVVSTGSGVSRVREGDRVVANFWTPWIEGEPPPDMTRHGLSLGGPLPGVLSEYIILHEDVLVHSPASLSAPEASTLPIAALTAWFALVETGRLHAGQSVLVQGTGGVAIFGLQLAKALGAQVIVTSRSAEKLARARDLGADAIIDTGANPAWAVKALELTEGRGVDHILELIGGDNLRQSASALASGGRIAQIGFLDGADITLPVLPLMLRRAVIQGITVGHRTSLENMIRAIDHHRIKPVIDTTYAFDNALAAFDHLGRGPFGKVVITLPGD
ncbi:NAD(P)-dependent alcohol dehydrogenase [Rothia nasimurium]|nr:NAD(P)-dependent alcohol dehydrogenase [Luteibacter anthropi]